MNIKNCNKTLCLGVMCFMSILFSACFHVGEQKGEPISTWNFETNVASSIEEVDANTVNGNITVTGNITSEAAVEMFVSGNGLNFRRQRWSDEEIQQELEKSFTIDVKVEGGKLLVIAKPIVDRSKFSISFKIAVPKSINSNLRTVNGAISINNLSGSQKLSTVNGSLNIEDISGSISGSTVNGRIKAKNSEGKISLTTVNGGVNTENLKGDISTSTVIGRVRNR